MASTDKKATASTLPDRIAHLVSDVFNPPYVALPTFLIVALHTAPSVGRGLLWWLVTTVGISIAPFWYVLQGVRRGRYTDRHISVRQQRLVPLLVALASTAATFAVLIALHSSRALLAAVVAVLVAGALTIAITTRWKISLHLVGIAGAVTVLVLLFGPLALLLTPLVPLVRWARWQVRAHTAAQAVAGTLLAIVVASGIFWLFGTL